MARDYGNDRLGGPPGLYDSPNCDRETNGGIVQRVRVPPAPESREQLFPIGTGLSLNDSDNLEDMMGTRRKTVLPHDFNNETGSEEDKRLQAGIPFSKSITGSNM